MSPSPRRLTRRRALAEALSGAGAVAGALTLAGCGGTSASPARSGSTLHSTWIDPVGDGQLRVGPGEPLGHRLELGPRVPMAATLGTLAHITDAHVMDASSPARVSFLARLGPPFQSTFRPQEALTVQVLAGTAAAVRALGPELVIQGGDLIDNDQSNELEHALAVLHGGRVAPGSGPHGYYGVQSTVNTDPFYYRPDIDSPRHPGLLPGAVRKFVSAGLGAPAYPVLGDHDALVAGEIVPTDLTRSLSVGDRALWHLPSGLTLPPGVQTGALASPDGPPAAGIVDQFLRQALEGDTVTVPADSRRRELSFAEVVSRLRLAGAATNGATGTGDRLDYTVDVGADLRLIVLDLVRRGGGSGGIVAADQPDWLAAELARAGRRWVIVITHQPLSDSQGATALVARLDRSPRVIAVLSGHIHRNEIRPRRTPAGGYWLITTASLIDYPQQSRALRVVATAGGGVAIQTWMLDHVFPGRLGTVARELSYIDAQGGRPKQFAGDRLDRNVVLYRRAAQ